jgi:hypothetical protein
MVAIPSAVAFIRRYGDKALESALLSACARAIEEKVRSC